MENKRLERHSGQQLQQAEHQKSLNSQAKKEAENTEAMQELAQQMESIFKEANKNGSIDTETMKKLAEATLGMKEMATQQMPKIQQKLNDAQSPESTADKTKSDLTKAVEMQQALLNQMEETIQKASEATQRLEAGTFVKRLRKAAGDQEAIANTHIEIIQNPHKKGSFTIGETFLNLDPSAQRQLFELYSFQEQTGLDVRWIQEDLGHFYSRTQKAEHLALFEEMQDSKVDADMELLNQLIERNHSGRSIVLAKSVAQQLRDWADQLENAQQAPSSSGGGDGKSASADADFEFMLKILELVQHEQNIRAKTRALEQKRRIIEPRTPSAP